MRDALAGLHLAGVVEGDVQLAKNLAVMPGGGDTERLVADTLYHGRVGTGSVQPQIIEVTKKRLGIAADDNIGTVDRRGKLQLVPATVMSEKHDVVDPRCFQLAHHLLRGFSLVRKTVDSSGLEDSFVLRTISIPTTPIFIPSICMTV